MRLRNIRRDITIGFFTGIIGNAIGVLIYILSFSKYDIETTLEDAYINGYLGALIGLAGFVNLLSFFLFLRIGQEERAKGVLMASFILALIILVLQISKN